MDTDPLSGMKAYIPDLNPDAGLRVGAQTGGKLLKAQHVHASVGRRPDMLLHSESPTEV